MFQLISERSSSLSDVVRSTFYSLRIIRLQNRTVSSQVSIYAIRYSNVLLFEPYELLYHLRTTSRKNEVSLRTHDYPSPYTNIAALSSLIRSVDQRRHHLFVPTTSHMDVLHDPPGM